MSLEMSAKKSIALKKITEPCMKLAVYERGGLLGRYDSLLNERFGDLNVQLWTRNSMVDFIPLIPIRQKALKNIREILGIRPEECIVFGDEYNDIAMREICSDSLRKWHMPKME